jgi:glycosyltransferase involved in cell wall biosynthesis
MTTLKSTKRIGILVARNNFVFRGVGAYVKSVLDWALSQGYHCDIISDSAVRDNGLFDQYQNRVQWITPERTIEDRVYRELSSFSKPFDTVLSLNFRNAMVRALSQHTYDLIITNVGEALDAVTGIGLHHYCCVLHPTHHESEAAVKISHDIFSPGVSERYSSLCGLPKVTLACQSHWVRQHAQQRHPNKQLSEFITVPPMVPELGLLDFHRLPATQWGVGFIGPWEPRKNPEAFVEAVKSAQLPAVVLVPSEASAKKFEARFREENIQYKIHVGVTGAEKTRIIQGMAAAYHPALSETFGLGALETAHCCPTVLLEENAWSQAHSDYATIVPKNQVVLTLQQLYRQGVSSQHQETLTQRHQHIVAQLNSIVNTARTETPSKNNFYKQLHQQGLIKHSDFVAQQATFCTDEIYKMLKIPSVSAVEVLHSYNETYYRPQGSTALPEATTDVFNTLFEL